MNKSDFADDLFNEFKKQSAIALAQNITSVVCVLEINCEYMKRPLNELVEESLMYTIPVGQLSLEIIDLMISSKECQQVFSVSKSVNIKAALHKHKTVLTTYMLNVTDEKVNYS